ncbi:hypothetical protein KC19_6G188900 [Ceratodon purpureus]|uniref:Uncharacterized protein n=1 Tax=Ceratodon purpureus TaxID=3225 RepID=A0A8T0HJ48_CERPU|nr:hypothetical protein KC19_6G188900 [Ceratodon purpureus]
MFFLIPTLVLASLANCFYKEQRFCTIWSRNSWCVAARECQCAEKYFVFTSPC